MSLLSACLLGVSVTSILLYALESTGRLTSLRLRRVQKGAKASLESPSPGNLLLGTVGEWFLELHPAFISLGEERLLVKAGHPWGYGPKDIIGMKMSGVLIGGLGGYMLLRGLGAALGCIAALVFPQIWLGRSIGRRRKMARDELARVLDLLVVYTTAGVPLPRSLTHLAQVHKGMLRPYLAGSAQEVLSGKRVSDAIQPWVEEIDVEEISAFVHSLARSERLGTPLQAVFRREARALRRKRSIDLQYRAGLLPLKLTICTTVFFLPSIIVLVIFPNILAFTRW